MTREEAKEALSVLKIYDNQWLREAIDMAIEALSAEAVQPLVLTCDGCRHVGTYDTDFPCSGCIRREKDYYEQER